MKLIYVLLVCVLVTMNSAFAMLCDKEGPSGEYNRYFFLMKETVIEHFGSEEPRYPYGMVQPSKPLVIEGCEYDLWGFMRGAIGENLKTDPTIQSSVKKAILSLNEEDISAEQRNSSPR